MDDERVGAFYDALADSYHLIYADWQASLRRQAAALDRIIAAALGEGPHAILDAACGIGTQAIGLALLGHRVHGADLSAGAVSRAGREAAARGAIATFGVADLRYLRSEVDGTFAVVLACDNALPHLLTDTDLQLAVASMAAMLRPGGLFLTSIRDYDRLLRERPFSEGPRFADGEDGRRICFQIWDWADDGRTYVLHQFVVQQDSDEWRTTHAAVRYRALLRGELDAAITAAGLSDIRRHDPEQTGFFQPIVTARKP